MRLGEVRFALVHHGACPETGFHYRIRSSGETETCASESERVGRAHCIEIVLEGDFDAGTLPARQLNALHTLLLGLKTRYPRIVLGGHRQVRGSKTTCPGRRFPLKDLLAWSRSGLIAERDAALHADVERQYRPPN